MVAAAGDGDQAAVAGNQFRAVPHVLGQDVVGEFGEFWSEVSDRPASATDLLCLLSHEGSSRWSVRGAQEPRPIPGLPPRENHPAAGGPAPPTAAADAGVSIDYYVRLERGHLAGASEEVLDAVANALQLDDAERAHLYDLARAAKRPARRTGRSRGPLPAHTRRACRAATAPGRTREPVPTRSRAVPGTRRNPDSDLSVFPAGCSTLRSS
ncbi:hypothetical protein GCM10017557_75980 [Streptomyces aurantiacus]|uniref:Helix-turn-helix domain-containing protein n=1 Tax=Streptomyces aurantiacus TaxID=47760 RepID=A0A7G1PBE5_9ACTN|nr:hypothetical protein GCM10017557_75980 [Streptomyces aurantiacus]